MNKPRNKLLFIARYLLALAITTSSFHASAFTSIASIKGHALDAWWSASNYMSQKEADRDALEGCRSEARKNGISSLAKTCAIVSRAKGPGYGAVTCGDDGCSWTTGYGDKQEAVDAAYVSCKDSYANCRSENINTWSDFSGFKQTAPKRVAAPNKSCIPTGSYRSCTSSCVNGDCIVTYQNGCKVRVLVPIGSTPGC